MKNKSKKQNENIEKSDDELLLSDVIQSLSSDEALIELAKNNCMLHRTSDELGFLVIFDLNSLRQFCTKLLKINVV